jgi:protein lifeguard
MSGREKHKTHLSSSPGGCRQSSVDNPTAWSTTLDILEPPATGLVVNKNIYATASDKDQTYNSTYNSTDNYISLQNEYNVKTNFIRRIYTLLCMQLTLTFGICAVFYNIDSVKNYVLHSPATLWASIIMTFVFLIVGSPPCCGRHHPINLMALLGFTLCESYLVGYTCLFYNSALVLMACGITLSTFVGLTAYVMHTKKDFNFLGAGLCSCLWILIIGGIISAFLPNMPIFNVAMAILGCITAVGYILYDTSEIINRMEIDEYVFACMSLYIDIIMLFVNLLQLLTGGNNRD